MAYTTIDDPTIYFNTKLYTGTGSSLANTGVGFQPDLTWIKGRSGATEHVLTDSVRGVTKELSSNDDGAEETVAQGLTAFGSDGFTVGTDGSYNTSSATYASWNWKAGTALSNSAGANGGSIATTGSINTTSGFGIVKYVGTGSNATIYHGLGKIPRMIITKNIDQSFHWSVYTFHSNTKILRLNGTNAEATESAFQSTDPTSTIQSLGTHNQNNGSGDTHISYMFCDVPGYQKIGSYTGNGSTDGTFVYTGFKPAYVMMKVTNIVSDWHVMDSARDVDNVVQFPIDPNSSAAEYGASDRFDFLSNGFKLRQTSGSFNGSGNTYIYMAFAENPFVSSTGVPATAR